jgi:serine/threonine protein kinase
MEFIAGATLQEVLAGGPLPPSEVVRLGSQLARGLAAVHEAHITHGDIKPENLKITSSGVLKIVDFGVAKRLPAGALLDYTPTTALTVVGTFPYMAPEVLRGERPDARSEIFSAGAVLYEMATACRAFPQRTLPDLVHAIEDGDVIAPSRVNPAMPVALDRVVMTALKKSPSSRFQSATELAEALERLLGSTHRKGGASNARASRWWHLTSAALGKHDLRLALRSWFLSTNAAARRANGHAVQPDAPTGGIGAAGRLLQ